MENWVSGLFTLLSSAGIIAAVSVGLFIVHTRLLDLYSEMPSKQFRRQLIMLGCVLAATLLVITLIPVSSNLKGQLLGLLGLLLSATIALSSTTLVGNSMAAIMLKVIKNCRPGDFIKVDKYFGRITEMDLLHTEIQTEDRDLTTLPNLFLVTHPVTVMRSSGSIIGVEVSLGYEYSRKRIETLLVAAARKAELEEPFVQIRQLGDFSVTYRIAGLLTDVTKLLAMRRTVRASILDTLHEAGIEIVSPTFMNTKALTKGQQMIPSQSVSESSDTSRRSPDELVFDKAVKAESIENLREKYENTVAEVRQLEASLRDANDEETIKGQEKLAPLKEKAARLAEIVQRAEERLADHD